MLHAEIGMAKPFSGSFNECVDFEMRFRLANPTIAAKNGWGTSRAEIEAYVDESNAQRCIAGGWLGFVDVGDPSDTQKKTGLTNPGFVRGAVAAAKAVGAGVATWLDLFGPEGKTVEREVAERRAAVCVACPFNDVKSSLTTLFMEKMAAEIQKGYAILNDLDLHTSQDAKLGVCLSCLCPLRSKVHIDIKHIAAHLSPEIRDKLHPRCWILSELKP